MNKRKPNYQIIDQLTQQVQSQQAEINRLRDLIDTLKFLLDKFDKSSNEINEKELELGLEESILNEIEDEEEKD